MKNNNTYLSKFAILFISVGLLSFTLTGCGGSGGTDTNPPGNGNGNEDGISFSSGSIASGESFSYTFEQEATVEYYCQIHAPDMQGVVTVSSSADISGETTVIMENIQFNPSSVTITPGTTVTWVNQDGFTHNILDGNPDDDSGNPNPPYHQH